MNDRSLLRSRVGPALVPFQKDGRNGAILVGGADAVKRSPRYAYGPFEPGIIGQSQFESECDPMASVMSFIDLDTGGLASVQGGTESDSSIPPWLRIRRRIIGHRRRSHVRRQPMDTDKSHRCFVQRPYSRWRFRSPSHWCDRH